MPDPFITGRAERQLLLGLRVDQPAKTLPASTYGALFNVTGGRIMVLALVGEVTTIIQAQANATKVTSTPTVGTAVDVSATLDINGKEVGCLFGVDGLFATAMKGANAGALSGQDRPFVVPIGSLGLTTAATNTGAAKWSLFYIPLDDGATVVAA